MPLMRRILSRLLFQIWQITRGVTLGVRAIVVDGDGRVLLVRHTYIPGWYLPGGGVERGETMVEALTREVFEEANVELTGEPELVGIYFNPKISSGDHVGLYFCRFWKQDKAPKANLEIAECGFFALGSLPEETTKGTRKRLAEVFQDGEKSKYWV